MHWQLPGRVLVSGPWRGSGVTIQWQEHLAAAAKEVEVSRDVAAMHEVPRAAVDGLAGAADGQGEIGARS